MSLEAAKTLKCDKTQATGADGLNDALVLKVERNGQLSLQLGELKH